MICHRQWIIIHIPLNSIQLCLVTTRLHPVLSSQSQWIIVTEFCLVTPSGSSSTDRSTPSILSCQSQWITIHRPLDSIQFCLVTHSGSSSTDRSTPSNSVLSLPVDHNPQTARLHPALSCQSQCIIIHRPLHSIQFCLVTHSGSSSTVRSTPSNFVLSLPEDHSPQTARLHPALSCHSQWIIIHRPLDSIQLCLVNPSRS